MFRTAPVRVGFGSLSNNVTPHSKTADEEVGNEEAAAEQVGPQGEGQPS
jgi:hypothetical protein